MNEQAIDFGSRASRARCEAIIATGDVLSAGRSRRSGKTIASAEWIVDLG